MARFACQDQITCDCEEFPIRNFSSESPDEPVFVAGIPFRDTPPIGNTFTRLACMGFCTSTVSQEEADLCALQAAQLCTWDSGPGGGDGPDDGWKEPVQDDDYRQRTIFSSIEQSCTEVCDDGSEFTYVLPMGAVQSVVSQADADIRAHAICLKRAKEKAVCFVTTSPLPNAEINVFYSVGIFAQGGTGDYTFAIIAGTLPAGLTFDPVGLITGTPTASSTSIFTVQVTDSNGIQNQKQYQLTVSNPDEVPCDLGVTDSTIIGDRSINTCLAGATASWTGLIIGTYTIEYISGGVQYANLDPFSACAPLGTDSWVANPPSFSFAFGINSNARSVFNGSTRNELPFHVVGISCGLPTTGFTSLGALESSFAGSISAATQSLESVISLEVADNYPGFASVSPVTWRLKRVRKTAIDYDIQVRFVDLASVLSSLTPFDSCTAGSGTVWDGTFPVFEPNNNYVNYEYRVTDTFNPFQLNSCLLDTPAVTKVYHDTAGQNTPTGCAWILAVTYRHPVQGNVVSWVGLGGNGYSPVGNYTFSSTVIGWTMFGKKTAVRAATTTALPANTRTLNVLTADAVGALPAIDGVVLNAADRVLVKDEALGANNGVYVVTDPGSGITPWILTRSTDLDTSAEMIRGIFMPVTEGTVNAGEHFRLVTNPPITLNTTSLSFTAIEQTIGIEQY